MTQQQMEGMTSMQKVDDQKYIVFKRDAFYQLMGELALPPYLHHEEASAQWDCAPLAQRIKERAEQECLPDAVVIRRQDAFAPPALDAYANAIQCVIEVLQQDGIPTHHDSALRAIADYFHEQACKAWDTQRKLPD